MAQRNGTSKAHAERRPVGRKYLLARLISVIAATGLLASCAGIQGIPPSTSKAHSDNVARLSLVAASAPDPDGVIVQENWDVLSILNNSFGRADTDPSKPLHYLPEAADLQLTRSVARLEFWRACLTRMAGQNSDLVRREYPSMTPMTNEVRYGGVNVFGKPYYYVTSVGPSPMLSGTSYADWERFLLRIDISSLDGGSTVLTPYVLDARSVRFDLSAPTPMEPAFTPLPASRTNAQLIWKNAVMERLSMCSFIGSVP